MHAPEEYEKSKLDVGQTDIMEAVPLILSKMSPIKSQSLILDFGCGAGSTGNKFFVPLAEESDSKIHAVDISVEMIHFAKTNFAHPRVEYYAGDILDAQFPLRNNKYDKIFALYVIHWIQDYKTAMRNIYKVLKPGGEFGFTVVSRFIVFDIHKVVGEHPKFKHLMQGYHKFGPEWQNEVSPSDQAKNRLDLLAKDLGFEILFSEIHDRKMVIDPTSAVGFYISLNPFANKIPAELMSDLRQLYRETSAKILSVDVDAVHHLEYEMLTYVVRKQDCSVP